MSSSRPISFDFSDAPEAYDAIVAKVDADLAASPFENPQYSFPIPGGGAMPSGCQNCATWVSSLGLNVPTTGAMLDFIPEFRSIPGVTQW